MALSPQLLQYKSSGVYRLEFDKSQTVNIPAETIRLVVGHSKKGPYNTPVLVESVEQFINVFGSIDRNLEKKGMFFHRSALAALTRGPILALNTAAFDSDDKISYVAPATNGSTEALDFIGSPAATTDDEYRKFFNTEKFWTPSDDAVNSVVGTAGMFEDYLIRFINIKQDNITVFIRKAQSVKPFDVTAREWYGEGNVPSYLNDFDLISDFMVDVFVFKGGFNAADMDTDPVYGELFNADGLLSDKLADFANLRQVSLIAQYTGSLLPGFVDLEGTQLYIETIINSEARRTGLFCAVHEDAVTNDAGTMLDLVGHVYNDSLAYDLLSYKVGAGDRNVDMGAEWVYAATASFATFTYDEANLTVNGGTDAAVPAFGLKVGQYIDAAEAARITKVTRIIKSVDDSGAFDVQTYTVYTVATPAAAFGGAYKTFEEASTVYAPMVIAGAVVGNQSIEDCLNAVGSATSLGTALADKDNITFRYIVDTFASYDAGNLLNKVQLASLAKNRQNASAIVNAPFIKDFRSSTNPSFTDANGAFNVNYVATGGNLDKNPSALYTLPSITDGANYAFYYGPGLIVRENNKDIVVPPAAYVSNNFIDKYTDSLPWAIVAGPRRGVVSGAGVVGAEYAFDKSDRDILEPFGYNPIVFQRGVGLTILGNKTAQQSVQSALSSAHVREVLIYIQDGIAAILKNYVFEFNTAQTRLEIKTLADSFLESVKADFGVYDYKNVMDTTNNTNDVIDANMGIIDTYVEPVKGLEIVVHRTTVLNTGEIATGNFS
jgi:hypothetical protein